MSADDPTDRDDADEPTPKPPPRRSAFGNAVGLAKKKKPAHKPRSSHVLTCPDCGAPREGRDLTCRYCGGKTTE